MNDICIPKSAHVCYIEMLSAPSISDINIVGGGAAYSRVESFAIFTIVNIDKSNKVTFSIDDY